MMRIALITALVIEALTMPCVAGAQMPVPQMPSASSEISASGVAEIHLTPDRATISVTVETRDKSASSAMSANNRITNGVSAAIRHANVPASALTTSDLSVDQYFPPRYDPREPPGPDGFVVRTSLRAETENISSVSQIVDSALAAGATRIGVQYSSSKMSDARRGALTAALAAARADASAVAQAAGGTLGRLLWAAPNGASPVLIRGVSSTGAVYSGNAMMSAPPPLPPPSIASTVVVSARWEFVPGQR
jgi:uncharacterized protein YggE